MSKLDEYEKAKTDLAGALEELACAERRVKTARAAVTTALKAAETEAQEVLETLSRMRARK